MARHVGVVAGLEAVAVHGSALTEVGRRRRRVLLLASLHVIIIIVVGVIVVRFSLDA